MGIKDEQQPKWYQRLRRMEKKETTLKDIRTKKWMPKKILEVKSKGPQEKERNNRKSASRMWWDKIKVVKTRYIYIYIHRFRWWDKMRWWDNNVFNRYLISKSCIYSYFIFYSFIYSLSSSSMQKEIFWYRYEQYLYQ